jgi:hypothetical protein
MALSWMRQQLEPPGVADGSVLAADRYCAGLSPASITTDVAEFEAALRSVAHAEEPEGPWAALTLAIAYSTETHRFITDVNRVQCERASIAFAAPAPAPATLSPKPVLAARSTPRTSSSICSERTAACECPVMVLRGRGCRLHS